MSAADVSESPRPAPPPDYPRVGLISLGHLTNDLYGNLMTSLTPYLILRGAISATLAGFVVLVYLIGSSVLQPIFGLLSDRTGRRYFATLGPIWIGVAASLFGWAGNTALLMLLAALGGVGTAAFHPQAATMVAQLGERSRGWTMSIFSLGGNVGFALGPVVAAAIAAVGLHWTPIILLPGIGLTLLLVLFAPHPARTGGQARSASIRKLAASRWRPLGLIV
ncbi:MAG: MFS transporter, partial [Chloroflexi bacterium]|nr:MFS transporter [Chloroflexota bacterium]